MNLFKTIVTIIFIFKLTTADLIICDNDDCKRPGVLTMDSLYSELKTIVEGNRNTTKYLQDLNERIDIKIDTLTREIKNIKHVLHEQSKKLANKSADYSIYDNLWIVVQRRQDGTIDFYRNWTDYKLGFGNPFGEFFVGLDKIHELTNDRPHELLVMLGEFDGHVKYAHYDHFLIGNETEQYILKKLGKYRGTAGDHLRSHLNMFFSTKDRDNDVADDGNCAEWFKGAWWYYHCLTSNLNGPYNTIRNLTETTRGIGITWGSYDDILFSFKSTQMMLRAKK
ncbi:ficolin-2-like [Calliphora vicina]|uniref:ficolin-2-like n=1 Tax=Calliphora vicina TaxID=7373 RepID=UPI00325B8FE7